MHFFITYMKHTKYTAILISVFNAWTQKCVQLISPIFSWGSLAVSIIFIVWGRVQYQCLESYFSLVNLELPLFLPWDFLVGRLNLPWFLEILLLFLGKRGSNALPGKVNNIQYTGGLVYPFTFFWFEGKLVYKGL